MSKNIFILFIAAFFSVLFINCESRKVYASEGYSFSLPKTLFSVDKKSQQNTENKLKPVKTSLSDFVKSYPSTYSDTFISTLAALSKLNLQINSYNTARGEINARLSDGKDLFILLVPSQEKMTHIRITPADGIYDIENDVIREIFKIVDLKLSKK